MIFEYGEILNLEHSVCLFKINVSTYSLIYSKFHSVTMMLRELALTPFEEIVENVGVIYGSKCRVPIRA